MLDKKQGLFPLIWCDENVGVGCVIEKKMEMEKSCGRPGRVASIGRCEPAPQSQQNILNALVYRKHKHSNKPFPYPEHPIFIISCYSLANNKAIMSCSSRIQAYKFPFLHTHTTEDHRTEASPILCKMSIGLPLSAYIFASGISLG